MSGREGHRSTQVGEAAREAIDTVGEGVADGDDDGIGLGGVDGLAAFDVLSCGQTGGVYVCDVPER